jgi:hypothetical protein
LEEGQVDRLVMEVEVVEEAHITGLIIFLLVRVKALVTQLELEVEVVLDGTTQMYLAEPDLEVGLHGFIVLVLFMRLVAMLDHQHMIFTEAQAVAVVPMEVTPEAMALAELALIQTAEEEAVVLVELGATAVTAVHQAAITFQAREVAAVAQELMAAVMLEVYMMEVEAEIIG